ncbi:MAG: ABC transporter substrate-binding protein [Deltaproteobacteria bacterium]|nr:MAG: ABC transporter substrate-binding protein [Deltaproteobacteria bacterium]
MNVVSWQWSVVGKSVFWLAIGAWLNALCVVAEAQQAKKVPLIGLLDTGTASSSSGRIEAFRQGLRELGYVEGQNISIDYRYSELAVELARVKVDILVASGGNSTTRALNQASKTIPIVMTSGSDAVDGAVVSSLARPGGNITGLTSLNDDLGGKRLQLLKETVPKVSRVGVLWEGGGNQWRAIQAAARELRLQVHSVEIRSGDDFEGAFKEAINAHIGALTVTASTLFSAHQRRIAALVTKNRLPAMYASQAYVDAGGLMYYGPNTSDLYRRAAVYVDKILKGAKPADLPVEQPKKFEFIVNLKAAKQIGLKIPPNVLARADKVIK